MPCREHRFLFQESYRSLELLSFSSELRFHLNDQRCQLLLTFFLTVGVDVMDELTAVGETRGLSSFP